MKRFFLIFSLCLLFAAAGCSKDKPTGEILPESETSDDVIVDAENHESDAEISDIDISDDESDTDIPDDDSDAEISDIDISDDESDADTSDDGDAESGEDTDSTDEDQEAEPTEAEKCTEAGGENWSAETGCTKTETCKGNPENSEWNGDDSYARTYADGVWNSEIDAEYSLDAGTCRFKCKAGFGWISADKKCVPAVLGRICTNQTKCYKENGDETDCSSGDFSGQDAYFAAAGKCIQQRFEVKTPVAAQPVVVDLNTGLVWEQLSSTETYTWETAENHCKDLNEMNELSGYAGYTDWRVPTTLEFFTIVDNGRANPAFDGEIFQNMKALYDSSSNLWTSQETNASYAYYFLHGDGSNWYIEKTRDDLNVVCVSGEKFPDASFKEPAGFDGKVVVDETTGLMWQKEYESGKTWAEALNYCKGLNDENYAGFDDWRLPNKNELASLLNLDKNAAPYSNFPDMPSEYFWSSSTTSDSTDVAWGVDFSYGRVGSNGKTSNDGYVRCVR